MAPSRRKLEPSKLAQQIEFLHDTIPTGELKLVTKGRTFAFSDSIISGEVHRTIEGASTLKLTVSDYYGKIRNSGMLGAEVDIKLDGLWFRLVAVNKSGNDLDLTFESREVAILRTYKKKRVVGWQQMSRTRFVQILMNEAPATRQIPFICPELVKSPPKDEDERAVNREYGFAPRKSMYPHGVTAAEGTTTGGSDNSPKNMKVKGATATPEQIANIETVLDVGVANVSEVNKHRRKILVCSIMTIIQESTARNLPRGKPGDYNYISSLETDNPIGIFQQRETINGNRSSWPATGNVAKDAKGFFDVCIRNDAASPKQSYEDLCESVQRSGNPHGYGQWRNQAEKWVTAYGIAGWDAEETTDVGKFNLSNEWEQDAIEFQFTRGSSKTLPGGRKGWKEEDTWTCMNRLAEEVNWRCFEVSGKVYFISEPKLFKSAPRAKISELSPGIDWIDFNYDVGKTNGQVTITGRAGLWAAPPGTVVEIMDNGPVNGRWIVTDINRGIFSPEATITCKKPRVKLPEPTQAQDQGGLWDNIWTGEPAETNTSSTQATRSTRTTDYPTGKKLRDAVLNNPQITFIPDSKRMDIQMNLIDERVLVFLLGFTDAGYTAAISSLKSTHPVNVDTHGSGVIRRSAHADGRAVDIQNFNSSVPGSARDAMVWIRDHAVEFQWNQLIGPIEDLVWPPGYYDRKTLNDHKSHIHVGWADPSVKIEPDDAPPSTTGTG